MEKDLARLVAGSALRAMSEIGSLVPMLDRHAPDEAFKHRIATAVAEIGANVLQPVLDAHPDLAAEFDARIATYGRAV